MTCDWSIYHHFLMTTSALASPLQGAPRPTPAAAQSLAQALAAAAHAAARDPNSRTPWAVETAARTGPSIAGIMQVRSGWMRIACIRAERRRDHAVEGLVDPSPLAAHVPQAVFHHSCAS